MPRSKLTPTVHKALVDMLAAGVFRRVAAQSVGISHTTLYSWLERGEADHEAGKTSPYADFHQAALQAEAKAEVKALDAISKAAPKDWRAAAWYLERRYQDRWGGKVAIEHSGRVGVDVAASTDDELLELAQGILDRRDSSA